MTDSDEIYIDKVLKTYGEIEPPMGLEARISAAVAQEAQHRKGFWVIHNHKWRVSLQVAAAMLLVLGASSVLLLQQPNATHPGTEEVSDTQLIQEMERTWGDIDEVNKQTKGLDEATNWVDADTPEDTSGT